MPLWAESRIHGDVYVRFGGRLSETYHRKVAWRRQPSLQVTDKKISKDMDNLMAFRRAYGTGASREKKTKDILTDKEE